MALSNYFEAWSKKKLYICRINPQTQTLWCMRDILLVKVKTVVCTYQLLAAVCRVHLYTCINFLVCNNNQLMHSFNIWLVG